MRVMSLIVISVGFAALLVCSALPSQAAGPATQPATSQPAASNFDYHETNVLGTSLDMRIVAASKADADSAAHAALDEIERLRRILSTYDPAAELARLNAGAGNAGSATVVSPEIIQVLWLYDSWNRKTNGAYNGHLGQLIALYKKAQAENHLPSPEEIAPVVGQLARPTWVVDPAANTVRRLDDQKINVDSLGKGFIIARAIESARKAAPDIFGMMLDIGGDIRVMGSSTAAGSTPWRIGIADPANPSENAPPLATLLLQDQAVATSAAYARFYTIQGRKYSHILDPRTGKPAEAARSATVVAGDNPTANALATTCCILPTADAIQLVQSIPGASCLIVAPDGTAHRSNGFAALAAPADGKPPAASQPDAFPRTNSVEIALTLKPGSKQRPYVAVWVEDSAGKPVKLLSLWADKKVNKYVREMPALSKAYATFSKDDAAAVNAVTRATRQAGNYKFSWDGTDTKNNPVPRGKYTIHVSVATEHIREIHGSATVTCSDKPDTATIKSSQLYEEIKLTYGPKGK